MAQFGDHHINVRTRGGQDVTLESEYGLVKMEVGSMAGMPREVVFLDQHEVSAMAAWMLGWVKAKAQQQADAIANHPSSETWSPRDAGSLGS